MDQPGQVCKAFLSGFIASRAYAHDGAFVSPVCANKSSVDGIADSGDSSMKRRSAGQNRFTYHVSRLAGEWKVERRPPA